MPKASPGKCNILKQITINVAEVLKCKNVNAELG